MGVEVDSRWRTEAEAGLTRLLAELFCADSTYRELMSSPLLAHLKQSMPGEGSSPLRRAETLVELLSHRGMVDDAFFLAVQGVAAGRRKEIERIRRLLHPPSAPPQALYSPAPPSSWSSAARPGLPALLLLGSTMGVLTVAVQWDTSSGALVTITAGDAAPAAGPGRREIHSVQILDALREIAIEEPDYSVLDLTRATHAATNGKLEFSAFAIDTELVSFEAFASWRAQTHTRPTRAEQHARDEGARRARGMPWGDARQYCLDRNGDLPSQYQWEIMARNLADSRGDPISQTGTLYPWGDEWSVRHRVSWPRGAWTMGHVLAQPVEPLGWSDVGFRCVRGARDSVQSRLRNRNIRAQRLHRGDDSSLSSCFPTFINELSMCSLCVLTLRHEVAKPFHAHGGPHDAVVL